MGGPPTAVDRSAAAMETQASWVLDQAALHMRQHRQANVCCSPGTRGLDNISVREVLFQWTATDLLRFLKRMLVLLGHPKAEKLVPRSFRAGKATSMAKAGVPLPHIMSAGKWRSMAALRYLQEQEVEETAFLASVLDADDSDA